MKDKNFAYKQIEIKIEQDKIDPKYNKPKVICLCGSTRFADVHAIIRWGLEQLGCICLMINYLPHWYKEQFEEDTKWDWQDYFQNNPEVKEHLDELHLRKIDMADEIFVINVHGYIGESTSREIKYAERLGKPVKYLINEENKEIQK